MWINRGWISNLRKFLRISFAKLKSWTFTFQKKKKEFFIWFNVSPLKLMKNVFYFILKAPFVLKIFWLCRKNGLIRKIKLISKLMTSHPGTQAITMHILPNILRSKGNQTIKFGQLVEYNKGNVFLQKSCKNWCKETSSWLFCFLKKLYMK